jgi:hypothetical protein
VNAVNRPVNVVTGWLDPDITLAQLSEAGAKRVSVGRALSRPAVATFVDTSKAMRESGSFAWMRDMIGLPKLRKMFEPAVTRHRVGGGAVSRQNLIYSVERHLAAQQQVFDFLPALGLSENHIRVQ